MQVFIEHMQGEGYDAEGALEEGRRRGWVVMHSQGDALASTDEAMRATAEEGGGEHGIMEFTQQMLDAVLPGAKLA